MWFINGFDIIHAVLYTMMKRNPVAFGEFLTCFSRILDFMTFQRPYIHDIGKVRRPIRPSMLKGLTVPRKTLNLVPMVGLL